MAAAIKKIGRLDRFASARPVSQVVYQATPDSPTDWGLSGTDIAPPGNRPLFLCPKEDDPQISWMHTERAMAIFTSDSVGEDFYLCLLWYTGRIAFQAKESRKQRFNRSDLLLSETNEVNWHHGQAPFFWGHLGFPCHCS